MRYQSKAIRWTTDEKCTLVKQEGRKRVAVIHEWQHYSRLTRFTQTELEEHLPLLRRAALL